LQALDFNETGALDVILVTDGYREVGVEGEYDLNYRHRKAYSVLIKTISICNWVRNFTVVRDASQLVVARGTPIFPAGWRPGLSFDTLGVPQHLFTPMSVLQVEALMAGKKFKRLGFDFAGEKNSIPKRNSVIFHPRCSRYSLSRNTPIDFFKILEEQLVSNGFDVKCIPDIDDVLGENLWAKNFECLSYAASDPQLRLKLSLEARVNVCWTSGNMAPLMFSRSRFVLFGLLNESTVVTSKSFYERKGPVVGRSPAWFGAGQAFDWTDSRELTAAYISEKVLESINDNDS